MPRRSPPSSTRSRRPVSPSEGRPAPTIVSPRPRWRTASVSAISEDVGEPMVPPRSPSFVTRAGLALALRRERGLSSARVTPTHHEPENEHREHGGYL